MIKLKKVDHFFEATIPLSPSDIILLKSTNSSEQEFMENIYNILYIYKIYILISSRCKFTETYLSKTDIDIINQEFLF